jgi:hypothetical protein
LFPTEHAAEWIGKGGAAHSELFFMMEPDRSDNKKRFLFSGGGSMLEGPSRRADVLHYPWLT